MKRNIGIIIVVLLLTVIIINVYNYRTELFETEKPQYDCIISINIHEKFNFLLKQLQNIRENVFCKYAVILNCNDFMFEECLKRRSELPENVYVHDKPLNKAHGYGSLTEGIYNNICYAMDHFNFEYFIVTSSRNMFTNEMKLEDLRRLKPYEDKRTWDEKVGDWVWPACAKTKLGKYYQEKGKNLYSTAHEGLVLTKKGCIKIIEFFDNNPEIKEDTFKIEFMMEELALQTISMNNDEPIYYIGNGTQMDPIGKNDPNSNELKFMYKVVREGIRT